MMELDSLNQEYVKCRALIEEKNARISQWQEEINKLAEDYQIEEANRLNAKKEKQHQNEKLANIRIKMIKEKVSEIEAKAIVETDEINELLEKIEELLQMIFYNKELKSIMMQRIEEQYSSKIEELVRRQKELQVEKQKLKEIRELLAREPKLLEDMDSIIEASFKLQKINFKINNLEHNGIISQKERSNQELLEKSKKEKAEEEKRKIDIQSDIESYLSDKEYELIDKTIGNMIEISIKEDRIVTVKKEIEKRVKQIENQSLDIGESINNNQKELEIVRKKDKWWMRFKGKKEDRKEQRKSRNKRMDKREEFLNSIEYQIVQDGIYRIKKEIGNQRKEREEETK